MTVAAMMIVATTEVRNRWAGAEVEAEDMVMVTITERIMTVGTITERGKGRRLGRGVQMRTKKCQK
jgi:hypothetical protein